MLIPIAQIVIPLPEDRATIQDITQAWNDRSPTGVLDYQWLLAALGALILLTTAISLYQRWTHGRIGIPGWWAFRSIVSQLGLDNNDRRLLQNIAQQQGLVSPMTLLTCHASFIAHADGYLSEKQPQPAALRVEVHALAERLFGVKTATASTAHSGPSFAVPDVLT